jgi:Family of unknown function (DUF6519)
MSSDRARVSYNRDRQYRTVVAQQGRVTLEADWNEAQQIASDEQREQLLDIVGSSGTPDDGYRVLETGSVPADAFDFSVQKGTMYAGGMRAVLSENLAYSKQSDWLDWESDPDWVDPSTLQGASEFVYLLLREQEVSAVEDSALREPALGGPDTMQRTRLIQHIARLQTEGQNCADVLELARKRWLERGFEFDAATMYLTASATLQVDFLESEPADDPCDPEARGGYLGAENQLIRVQISSTNPTKLVWGFDNASFLYRVTATNGTTLKLQSAPVDDFHRPRSGQAVEILRSAAELEDGEYVASPTGIVQTLTAPYNPDTQEIVLPNALPEVYTERTPQLFLRVWEEELPFTPGAPVTLGKTGLQVTLASPANLPFPEGTFWFFAVRPMLPTTIYPQRYEDAPQPPEGPRLWVCPLAVIGWNKRIIGVLEDCRSRFEDLVTLTKRQGGGCCTVVVKPEDLKGDITLQSILDRYVNRERVTICLLPRTYALPEPLRLGLEHSNLTLEGCRDGAVLEAQPGKEANFLQGLIILNRANNVTLRRLRFQMPQVPFFATGGTIAGFPIDRIARYLPRLEDLRVSIGIRPLHCALLAVEDCLFRYELTKGADGFGVGIFAGSENWGLTVKNCRFLHDEEYLQNLQEPLRMFVGYLLAPSLSLRSLPDNNPTRVVTTPSGSFTRSHLQDATFENNQFSGLTFAAVILADIGTIRIANNTVRDCYSGFWLLTLRNLSLQDEKLREIISEPTEDPIKNIEKLVATAVLGMIQEPVTYLTLLLARGYPLPNQFDARNVLKISRLKTINIDALQPITRLREGVRSTFREGTLLSDLNPNLTVATDRNFNVTDFALKETVGFAKTLGDRIELIQLAALEKSTPFPLQISLDFSHNEIETLAPKAPSGSPLFIWDTDGQTESAIVMSGNHLRNKSFPLAAALILQIDRCSVTGNLILNESVYQPKPNTDIPQPLNIYYSLVLLPGWVSPELLKKTPTPGFDVPIAITGNVFKGFPILFHIRLWPAPLNTWLPFNTATW